MNRSMLALLFAASLSSCGTQGLYRNPSAPSVMAETRTGETVEGIPTWGAPVVIPGAATRILPYAREQTLRLFSDRDNFDEGYLATPRVAAGFGGSADDLAGRRTATAALRWHNGVVVDLEDGTQWPLLAQRGVLSRYWMRIDHREEQRVSTALLFAATVEDTNGDGKLNSLDAVRALRTDPDGRNPRLISPAGTQLHDVLFDPVADVAVLMIATDADRDGKFSVKERVEPFLLELGSDQPLRRLISPETKAAVEAALTGS